MNALEELAQPRGPFPSPGSLRGLLWVLGALLWLGAWTLWYRRRPKTPRGDRASPLQEALARLRELEGREREGLDGEESHLLAVELGGILRRYFEARLRKPCLGLPQESCSFWSARKTRAGRRPSAPCSPSGKAWSTRGGPGNTRNDRWTWRSCAPS